MCNFLRKPASNIKAETINTMNINSYVSGAIFGAVCVALYCLLPKRLEKRKRNGIAILLGIPLALLALFIIDCITEKYS